MLKWKSLLILVLFGYAFVHHGSEVLSGRCTGISEDGELQVELLLPEAYGNQSISGTLKLILPRRGSKGELLQSATFWKHRSAILGRNCIELTVGPNAKVKERIERIRENPAYLVINAEASISNDNLKTPLLWTQSKEANGCTTLTLPVTDERAICMAYASARGGATWVDTLHGYIFPKEHGTNIMAVELKITPPAKDNTWYVLFGFQQENGSPVDPDGSRWTSRSINNGYFIAAHPHDELADTFPVSVPNSLGEIYVISFRKSRAINDYLLVYAAPNTDALKQMFQIPVAQSKDWDSKFRTVEVYEP